MEDSKYSGRNEIGWRFANGFGYAFLECLLIITESQNVRGWKSPLWIIQSNNPPAEAVSPQQAAQDLVQASLEVTYKRYHTEVLGRGALDWSGIYSCVWETGCLVFLAGTGMAPVRQGGECSLDEVQCHGGELSVVLWMDVVCAPEFCLLPKWPFDLAVEGHLEKAASVLENGHLPASRVSALWGLPPALSLPCLWGMHLPSSTPFLDAQD